MKKKISILALFFSMLICFSACTQELKETEVVTASLDSLTDESNYARALAIDSNVIEKAVQSGALEFGASLSLNENSFGALTSSLPSFVPHMGLDFTIAADYKNNKSSFSANLLYDTDSVVDLNTYFSSDELGYYSTAFNNKVYFMKVDGNLYERINNSPLFSDYADLFAEIDFVALLSDAQKNQAELSSKISEKYSAFIDSLTANSNSESKDFVINGKTVTAKGYDILVTKDAFNKFVSDIYSDYIDYYTSTLGEETVDTMEFPSVEDVQEVLDEYVSDYTVTVYITDDKKVVSAVSKLEFASDTDSISLSLDFTAKGGPHSIYECSDFTFKVADDTEEISIVYSSDLNVADSLYTYTDKLTICEDAEDIFDIVNVTAYDKKSHSYDISLTASADGEECVKLSIDGIFELDLKSASFTYTFDNLSVDVEKETVISLSGSCYAKAVDSVKEAPADATKVDIFAMTETDITDFTNDTYSFVFRLLGDSRFSELFYLLMDFGK